MCLVQQVDCSRVQTCFAKDLRRVLGVAARTLKQRHRSILRHVASSGLICKLAAGANVLERVDHAQKRRDCRHLGGVQLMPLTAPPQERDRRESH